MCLDMKRENWERTAELRIAHGHQVHLFDSFDEEDRTAQYNPLSTVHRNSFERYDDLQRTATMLFPADIGSDPFWYQSARSVFIAIAGYVAETPALPPTHRRGSAAVLGCFGSEGAFRRRDRPAS